MIATSGEPDTDRLAELMRVVLGQADEIDALSDRLLYAESALHHLAELVGLDLPGIVDPTIGRDRP